MSTVIYKAVLSDGEDGGVYNRSCSTTFKARYFKVQTNHLDADQKNLLNKEENWHQSITTATTKLRKLKFFSVKNREI